MSRLWLWSWTWMNNDKKMGILLELNMNFNMEHFQHWICIIWNKKIHSSVKINMFLQLCFGFLFVCSFVFPSPSSSFFLSLFFFQNCNKSIHNPYSTELTTVCMTFKHNMSIWNIEKCFCSKCQGWGYRLYFKTILIGQTEQKKKNLFS